MKKKIVIVLIALLSYFCIVILIYGVNILINKQNYLVINNSAVFKYNKNKWDKVDNKDSITGNKYYTYVDNEYYQHKCNIYSLLLSLYYQLYPIYFYYI